MRNPSCWSFGILALAMTLLSSCCPPAASVSPVPEAPSGLTAAITTSQATISWTAAGGAASYNLYRSTTTGVTKANGTKFAGVTSPVTQTGLGNGTTLFYVVTAVNSAGESAESSQVSATPIAAPTGAVVQYTKEGAQADPHWNFHWNDVTGATSYNVYYRPTTGVTPQNGTKITVSSSPCQLDLFPVLETYYFIATAVNAKGESVPSAEAGG